MTREKTLETVMVIMTGLLVICVLLTPEWYLFKGTIEVLFVIAASVGLLSLLFAGIAKGISFIWYKIAEGMGFVMSRIMLSIVFYIFLFPLSVMFRLFNKDPLLLKKKHKGSYYRIREISYQAKDIENPW